MASSLFREDIVARGNCSDELARMIELYNLIRTSQSDVYRTELSFTERHEGTYYRVYFLLPDFKREEKDGKVVLTKEDMEIIERHNRDAISFQIRKADMRESNNYLAERASNLTLPALEALEKTGRYVGD